jgi:acetyltransferase-like isoleucine patch superfamily enzyme
MKIHPTAIISKNAKIGENVRIGQFTTIYDNVIIDDDVVIEGYSEIGVQNHLSEGIPLHISRNSYIRSHSIFYEGSNFEEGLVTGHRVTVREKTHAGKNLQIGTLSDIQGDCIIGDYVRFHSNVHIGQKSKIGDFIWIFPYVVLTNDPHPPSNTLLGVTIEDYAVIATMSIVLPGVTVATGSLIAAHSSVVTDTEENMLYRGSPARKVCATSRVKLKDGSRKPAYPWINHFQRGYPDEVTEFWRSLK